MADIYRKSALERISSPEQLDKAIVVASPMSWLALGAATVIVLILIVWGFFTGELSDTVTAPGILHSPTGVNTIYAREPGTITDIPAYEGMVLTPDHEWFCAPSLNAGIYSVSKLLISSLKGFAFNE